VPRLTPRRLTAKSKAEAEKGLERFVRTERWNGLQPGDPVRIKGIKGGIWRYRCFVLNSVTGATWVEVSELEPVAGVPVDAARRDTRQASVKSIRTFDGERIIKLPKPRARRSAEFEQLDFGARDCEPTDDACPRPDVDVPAPDGQVSTRQSSDA
jgi:hypothetical protein